MNTLGGLVISVLVITVSCNNYSLFLSQIIASFTIYLVKCSRYVLIFSYHVQVVILIITKQSTAEELLCSGIGPFSCREKCLNVKEISRCFKINERHWLGKCFSLNVINIMIKKETGNQRAIITGASYQFFF